MLASLLAIFTAFKMSNLQKDIDCSKTGVILLKPSELKLASGLANRINGVVYFPETKQILGRTEVLKCGYDYTALLNGKFENQFRFRK